MSSWGLENPEWEGEPEDVPAAPWKRQQWQYIQQRHDYNEWWKHQYHPGDEVIRAYNGESGHIMEVMPSAHGDRYKVTSPSNPSGFTIEWETYLKPYTEPPKAPDDISQLAPTPAAEDYYRDQQPLPPGTSAWKIGDGWNPFKSDEIKWVQPSSQRDFLAFVNDVMRSVGIEPNNMFNLKDNPEYFAPGETKGFYHYNEQGEAARNAIMNKYHDQVLRITNGAIPDGRRSYDLTRENYTRGVQLVASQMPIILQNQIPKEDMRNQMDQEHADQYYNGIVPKDPSMRAQYPRGPVQQPTLPISSRWQLRSADLGRFHEDAAQSLEDYAALARDIMRTLPEEEWPQWVKNQSRLMAIGPEQPVDMTPYPHNDAMDTSQSNLTFPEDWKFSSLKKTAETPANYSDDDPLDMENTLQLVQDLDSQWWTLPPDQQRQAIANAFRAALTSPRQNLQWNSIVYQDMQELGPEVADPDVFENHIRQKKSEWDQFGQQTLDAVQNNSEDPAHITLAQRQQGMSKYMPGIWQNVRNAGIVGPYIEPLRQAALKDVAQGGTGQTFRQELMDLNIPGIGPKIAAFVWLLLCPTTSKLATIDIHMMRALGQKDESPANFGDYLKFEQQLDQQRQDMGYHDVPLGAFQWALWDWQRTPGYHQDHTPLRPVDPTPWWEVDWAPQQRVRKQAPPEVSQDQQSLFDEQPQDQEAPMISASWKKIE